MPCPAPGMAMLTATTRPSFTEKHMEKGYNKIK